MERICFLLMVFVSSAGFSQSTGPFAIWEDQPASTYKFVRIDAATGVKTNISSIGGLTGFVLGSKSAINRHMNYYYFAGQNGPNARFYTVDISTGTVLSNPIISDNVVGIEYNPADSLLYGIKVAGNMYSFCTVDPVTAQASVIVNINITGYVSGSFSLDIASGLYNFIAMTVTGFRLKSIDVQTGVIVHDNAFPDNVVGHRYNCSDTTLYGLWEVNNVYTLEKINYVNGTHTTVDTLAGVTPGYVAESHSMNESGMYTFRGFNGPNFAVISVDVSTAAVVSMNNTTDNAAGFEEPGCAVVTGINPIDRDYSISVFPNPSNGTFFVASEANLPFMEIYTVTGEKIFYGTSSVVDLLGRADGVYFLRSTAGAKTVYTKITIKK